MTDLKQLLDAAAGAEPGLTDADLSADLDRGRRAACRRRVIGIGTAAVATALVVGVGWSALPSGTQQGELETAAGPTPTASALPATEPVALVANTTPFPGATSCDLIPQGWAARRTSTGAEVYDPRLGTHGTAGMTLRTAAMSDHGDGLTLKRAFDLWDAQPGYQAGQNAALVNSSLTGDRAEGVELLVRQGTSKLVIVVSNNAGNLGWDLTTLLRFAGSCHKK